MQRSLWIALWASSACVATPTDEAAVEAVEDRPSCASAALNDEALASLRVDQLASARRIDVLEEELAHLTGRRQWQGHPAYAWIGVPECDLYVSRYSACIDDKLPDAVKETSRRALETSTHAWAKAAQTPAGREGLAQACMTATEAVRASCGWQELPD